uniref:Ubiquitinspecific protease putative n=1 Tax=Albugo laibachii Nc14 TaxID=890382 RepID=F0WAH3_9STRA|nr:ubiquitinspecific protease putative [Albugo laibachii Nc14]|eukprot:CCA18144.1 ubiquitinspecific protease putative [Albugo laibachii Nc14]
MTLPGAMDALLERLTCILSQKSPNERKWAEMVHQTLNTLQNSAGTEMLHLDWNANWTREQEFNELKDWMGWNLDEPHDLIMESLEDMTKWNGVEAIALAISTGLTSSTRFLEVFKVLCFHHAMDITAISRLYRSMVRTLKYAKRWSWLQELSPPLLDITFLKIQNLYAIAKSSDEHDQVMYKLMETVLLWCELLLGYQHSSSLFMSRKYQVVELLSHLEIVEDSVHQYCVGMKDLVEIRKSNTVAYQIITTTMALLMYHRSCAHENIDIHDVISALGYNVDYGATKKHREYLINVSSSKLTRLLRQAAWIVQPEKLTSILPFFEGKWEADWISDKLFGSVSNPPYRQQLGTIYMRSVAHCLTYNMDATIYEASNLGAEKGPLSFRGYIFHDSKEELYATWTFESHLGYTSESGHPSFKQWKCSSCAFVNKPSASFCISCGKPAPTEKGSTTIDSTQQPLANPGFSRGIFFGKDDAFLRVQWSRGEQSGVWLARKCETKNSFDLRHLRKELVEASCGASVYANGWNPDHVVLINISSSIFTSDMTIEFWMLPRQADGFQVILSSRDHVVYLTPKNDLIWQAKGLHTERADPEEPQEYRSFLHGGTMELNKFTHVSLTMEKKCQRLIRINSQVVADSHSTQYATVESDATLDRVGPDQRPKAPENVLFVGGRGHLSSDVNLKVSDCFGGPISDIRLWSIFTPLTEQLSTNELSLCGNELNLLGYYPLVGDACRLLMDKSKAENHAGMVTWYRDGLLSELKGKADGSPMCQVPQYPVQDVFVKEIRSLLVAGNCELDENASLHMQRTGLGSSVWINDSINIKNGFHTSFTIKEGSDKKTSPSPLLLGIFNHSSWKLSSCLREAKAICDKCSDTCLLIESESTLMTTTAFFVVLRHSSNSDTGRCTCDIAIFVWRAQKALQICRASHISVNDFATISMDYSVLDHLFKLNIEGIGILECAIDLESALAELPTVNDVDMGSARFGIIIPNLTNTTSSSVHLTEWIVHASGHDTMQKDVSMKGLNAIYPHLTPHNALKEEGEADREPTISPLTLCTLIRFDGKAMEQEIYDCQTCKLDHGAICRTCAIICHSGHDLIATSVQSISCACHSRGSDLCQCTTQSPKITVDLFPTLQSGIVAPFWRCDQCTVVNEASASVCKVCGRKTTISQPQDTVNAPIPSTKSDRTSCESAKSALLEWSCTACTMLNAPNATKCAVCETARHGQSIGKETQSEGPLIRIHPSSSGVATKSPNNFLVSHWDCQACTMQNPANNVACYMCATPRVVSQLEPKVSDPPDTSMCEALKTSMGAQDVMIERNATLEKNLPVLSTLYADTLSEKALKKCKGCDFVGKTFWETTIGNMHLNTMDDSFTCHYVNGKCAEGDGSIHGIARWEDSSKNWRLRGAYKERVQSSESAIDIQWNTEGSRLKGKLHRGNGCDIIKCSLVAYTSEFRGLKKVAHDHKNENLGDPDSEFQPFYSGLLNMQDRLTNICYQNSYLQALFMTKAFRQLILGYPRKDNEEADKEACQSVDKSITKIVQDIFLKLLCSQRPFIATHDLQSCIPSEFNGGRQQDTSDFAHYLMDALSSEVVQEHMYASKLARVFGGSQSTIITCKKCEKHSIHEEYSWELLLNMVDLKYTPIVDICAVNGNTCDIQKPEGFERLNFDLNQGRAGSPPHVFLFVRRAPEAKSNDHEDSGSLLPVTEIVLKSAPITDATPCMSSEYERVDVNLNVGGSNLNNNKRQIYMFFKRDPNGSPITDLHVIYGSEPLPDGYNLLDIDLNMGDGGSVFLCYRCDMPITDIKLVDSKVSGYTLLPESLLLKGPSTNLGSEQYLAYKVGGRTDVCVTDLTVVSESRSKDLIQLGWQCVGMLGKSQQATFQAQLNDEMEHGVLDLDLDVENSAEECDLAFRDHVMVLRGHGNPIVAIDVFRAPRQVPKFSDYEIQPLDMHLDAKRKISDNTNSQVANLLSILEGSWKGTDNSDQCHRCMEIDPISTANTDFDKAFLVLGHCDDKDEIVAVAIPIRKPLVTWGQPKEKSNNASEPDSGAIDTVQVENPITCFQLTGYVRDSSRSSDPHVMQFDLTTPPHEDPNHFCTILGNMGDDRGMLLPFSAIQRSKKALLKRPASSLVLLRGDESIPENVEVVRATVSGNTGNLLAQSSSPHGLYLGVTRDPSSSHYVDEVCVIYGGIDAVPEKYISIESTPAGYSANLNDGTAGVTMFICYRLASFDDQIEGSQTVMDLALIWSSQGHNDAIPPNFCKVAQTPLGLSANLNEGTHGVTMFLCVKKQLLREVPGIIPHPMNGRYEILSHGNGPPSIKFINLCVTRIFAQTHPIKGRVGPKVNGRAPMNAVRGILCVNDSNGTPLKRIIGFWTPIYQGRFTTPLPVFPFELTLKESDEQMDGWYSSPVAATKPEVLTIKAPSNKASNAIGTGRPWCLRKDSYIQIAFKKDYGSEWKDGTLISSERVWRHDIPSMLKRFTATRTMGGQDALSCSRCQEKTESRTHTVVVSPPNHLVLTLKRMYYDVKQQKTQKCLQDVAFPAFLTLPNVSPEDEEIINAIKESDQIHQSQNRQYGLYAVLIHSGLTANSGHYYSFCRVSDGDQLHLDDSEVNPWIKFNDTKVEVSSMKEINRTISSVSDSVYLLLYKKLDYKVESQGQCNEGDEALLLAKAMALSMSAAIDSADTVCTEKSDDSIEEACHIDRHLVAKVEQKDTAFLNHLEKVTCSEEYVKDLHALSLITCGLPDNISSLQEKLKFD